MCSAAVAPTSMATNPPMNPNLTRISAPKMAVTRPTKGRVQPIYNHPLAQLPKPKQSTACIMM
ncbi:hypothetical protein H4R33_000417 [Dimargaris cristalligena]|nr:hypothetical protein H4R33_000417 [Dimargaris cristalligena]